MDNDFSTDDTVIYITMGDPAGIGPEIIARWFDSHTNDSMPVVVVGDLPHMEKVLKLLGINKPVVSYSLTGKLTPGALNILHTEALGDKEVAFGEISGLCGKASFDYIEKAVDAVRSSGSGVIVTAPIHKESLRASGVPYIGHTEILAGLAKEKGMADKPFVPLTMFQTGALRIFFLSRHLSLIEACRFVTKENLETFIPQCCRYLKLISPDNPTLCVAGLNPHCGEHGLFGDEEVNEIIPAIESLREKGLPVTGPVGADSVFYQAASGRYGAVASLYHDQGHIAAKTLDFHGTVSVTLGLPFLRTSVDHGTAFDIAGKGIADFRGLGEAVRAAVEYKDFYV